MDFIAQWLEDPVFEVFPAPGIEGAVSECVPRGSRIAVTHSPRQGLVRSGDIAAELSDRGFEPVIHIAARGVPSLGALSAVVETVAGRGVREAFLIGGDQERPAGPYRDAADLLAAVNGLGRPFARIGVAGHPEGHPHVADSVLMDALLRKQDLGADYVATQMCFDAAAWADWAEAYAAAGVNLPLSVGVPGVVDRKKLLRIGIRAGAGPSLRALRAQKGFAKRALGGRSYSPGKLLMDLAALPGAHLDLVTSVHFFTFNNVRPTLAWAATVRPEGDPERHAGGVGGARIDPQTGGGGVAS